MIADQYRALRVAAREIELEEDVILASFFCTYLPALPDFMVKIARAPPERFRRSHRPHGLLVTMAAEAAEGQIRPVRGDRIPMRGEIAIFGKRDGHGQNSTGDSRARSAYLAACVVGRAGLELSGCRCVHDHKPAWLKSSHLELTAITDPAPASACRTRTLTPRHLLAKLAWPSLSHGSSQPCTG